MDSSATKKKEIHYLSQTELSEMAQEVRTLPLVRYRYKTEDDRVTPTVGVIIEDVPGASFVERDGKRVNLYSFVSATAAAYQAQAAELDETRAQVQRLEARISALEASCAGAAGAGGRGTRSSR